MKLALVLSGGGMFGAWQAGAWRELARRIRAPDLIVGASVGSLNGWGIAGGIAPDELCDLWMHPEIARFDRLQPTIHEMMSRYPLRTEYALTITDLVRMKPKIVRGQDVTWKHIAASCAIPLILPQQRIDGRIYSDGGLLNPLPVWAAVELGATHIIGLNALPDVFYHAFSPFVKGFRKVFGYHPPVPEGIEQVTLQTPSPLGSFRDAVSWKRSNMERWIAHGGEAAKNISIPNCFGG